MTFMVYFRQIPIYSSLQHHGSVSHEMKIRSEKEVLLSTLQLNQNKLQANELPTTINECDFVPLSINTFLCDISCFPVIFLNLASSRLCPRLLDADIGQICSIQETCIFFSLCICTLWNSYKTAKLWAEQHISKWLHTPLQHTEPNCYRTLNGHVRVTLSNPYLPSPHTQRGRGENHVLTLVETVGWIKHPRCKSPLYMALEKTRDFGQGDI